jgi:hypothetical protein
LCWQSELPLVRRLHPQLRGLGRVMITGAVPVALVLMILLQKPVKPTGEPAGAQQGTIEDYMNFGK